jgi:hypothetical protein
VFSEAYLGQRAYAKTTISFWRASLYGSNSVMIETLGVEKHE